MHGNVLNCRSGPSLWTVYVTGNEHELAKHFWTSLQICCQIWLLMKELNVRHINIANFCPKAQFVLFFLRVYWNLHERNELLVSNLSWIWEIVFTNVKLWCWKMTCLFGDRTALRSCSENCSEELLSSLLTNFNCLATVCSVIYTGGEKKKRQKIIHMVFGTKNSSFHLFLSKALFHITCETVDHGCANSWTETVADSYLYQQKRKAVIIFSLILVT